jgi:hypothetical protein
MDHEFKELTSSLNDDPPPPYWPDMRIKDKGLFAVSLVIISAALALCVLMWAFVFVGVWHVLTIYGS